MPLDGVRAADAGVIPKELHILLSIYTPRIRPKEGQNSQPIKNPEAEIKPQIPTKLTQPTWTKTKNSLRPKTPIQIKADNPMPRQKPADKIDMLRRQQADIAAKLKAAETKAREKSRDDEQRRERLAGRCALARLDQEPNSKWSQALLEMLGRSVKRPADRALFPSLDSIDDHARSPEATQDGAGEIE